MNQIVLEIFAIYMPMALAVYRIMEMMKGE
jgi:hypothetical protein